MRAHRRAILYAALALAVPLPALALTGEGGPDDPAADVSISVSASLGGCGTAADTIVCKIDATWNDVPGAERYTASVTRADGSVVDFGDVGGGGSSFWVPYVGNGTYTVTVSAYGTPPGEEGDEIIAKGSSAAGPRTERARGGAAPDAPGPASGVVESGDADETADPGPGAEPDPEQPACDEPTEPPVPEEPTEPPAPLEPPDGNGGEATALSAEAEAALSERAALPESVECPADDEEVATGR